MGGGATPETTYYQYDSKGKRLRKITKNYAAFHTAPTQKNQRIYIESYEFYEDYTNGDQTHCLSLIDQGNRFVMIEDSNNFGQTIRYEHPNHQSSCTLETNDQGNVITYEEYHPFGTTSYQATDPDTKASAKRYRYTGMERDEETGLNYHNARYYIPWLGRWMNTDAIGIKDGVNVYAYCHNNPINGTDTSGTQMLTPPKNNEQLPMKAYTGAEVEITAPPSGNSGFFQGFTCWLSYCCCCCISNSNSWRWFSGSRCWYKRVRRCCWLNSCSSKRSSSSFGRNCGSACY